jgi:ribonuclease D
MNCITQQKALDALWDHVLPQETVLFIDTEFHRKNTYYPILSLIQIATERSIYIIDALAPLNLDGLTRFFASHPHPLVFFSARQDLEIFHHHLGVLPKVVFDVQIALEALGYASSTGYGTAVQDFLGQSLDKSQQHTNWIQRPLKPEQIHYASKDVMYLKPLYHQVQKALQGTPKGSWLQEDMAFLTDPNTYTLSPLDAWKKCTLQSQNLSYLIRLQHLCALRESLSQSQDKPRQHILKDASIQFMALKKRVPPDMPENLLKAFQETLDQCHSLPLSSAPILKKAPAPIPGDLKKWALHLRQQIAQNHHMNETYVCTMQELDNLLRKDPQGRLKRGWRYGLMTEPVLECLNLKTT